MPHLNICLCTISFKVSRLKIFEAIKNVHENGGRKHVVSQCQPRGANVEESLYLPKDFWSFQAFYWFFHRSSNAYSPAAVWMHVNCSAVSDCSNGQVTFLGKNRTVNSLNWYPSFYFWMPCSQIGEHPFNIWGYFKYGWPFQEYGFKSILELFCSKVVERTLDLPFVVPTRFASFPTTLKPAFALSFHLSKSVARAHLRCSVFRVCMCYVVLLQYRDREIEVVGRYHLASCMWWWSTFYTQKQHSGRHFG